MTTSVNDEHEVEQMVLRLSPSAERTYQMAGTQKFEMPKEEISIADVFQAVEVAKSRFPVYAWGLSDTTLEDVFIKVANSAQHFHTLTWLDGHVDCPNFFMLFPYIWFISRSNALLYFWVDMT